ncbi:MAG: hypothetical protein ACRCT8_12530 [Lacipirellulaceae bacterium]
MPPLRAIVVLFALSAGRAFAAEPAKTESLALAPDVYNGVAVAKPDVAAGARLFAAANESAARGDVSRALTLATRGLAADPDHAEARRVLGYERVGDRWLTPWQRRQVERGEEWDPRFGWVRTDDVPRYERGERLAGGKWLPADVAIEQHARIEDGYQVRTDSFVVTTNHSLEAGAALAAELEGLRQAWRQVFSAYVLTPRQTRDLFAGKREAPRSGRAMAVYYHRSKEGYVAHLRRRQARIADTSGIYFDVIRQSHFFHDTALGGPSRATLYHEGVHQLFQESRPTARGVGRDANFWAVEGVACAFEGLAPRVAAGRTVGYTLDLEIGRTTSARRRVAEGKPPMPLAELVGLGWSDFQRQADLAGWYAQSTALAAMLLDASPANGPPRRDAFVEYLAAVYGERPDADQLARSLGTPLAELDRQFREFLAAGTASEPAAPGANLSR